LNFIVQLPVRNRDLIVALLGFLPRRSRQNLANFIVRLDRFFTVKGLPEMARCFWY